MAQRSSDPDSSPIRPHLKCVLELAERVVLWCVIGTERQSYQPSGLRLAIACWFILASLLGCETAWAQSQLESFPKATLPGEIDVAAVGRSLTPGEQTTEAQRVALGQDAIAIIVGQQNPFTGPLTLEQLRQIFSGELISWAQLGGPDRPIHVIDRPVTNDTRQALSQQGLLPLGTHYPAPMQRTVVEDTAAVVLQLGDDGIGYAIASQLTPQLPVRVLPLQQVQETLPDVARYPLSLTRAYAYADPSLRSKTRSFLGFVSTEVGQRAIAAGRKIEAIVPEIHWHAPAVEIPSIPVDMPSMPDSPSVAQVPELPEVSVGDGGLGWLSWLSWLGLAPVLALLGWLWRRRFKSSSEAAGTSFKTHLDGDRSAVEDVLDHAKNHLEFQEQDAFGESNGVENVTTLSHREDVELKTYTSDLLDVVNTEDYHIELEANGNSVPEVAIVPDERQGAAITADEGDLLNVAIDLEPGSGTQAVAPIAEATVALVFTQEPEGEADERVGDRNREALAALEQALEEARAQQQGVEVKLAALQEQLQCSRTQCKEAQAQRQTIEVALAALQSQLEASRTQWEEATSQQQTTEAALAALQEQFEASQNHHRETEIQLRQGQAALAAQVTTLEQQRATLEAQVANLEQQREILTADNSQLQAEVLRLHQVIQASEAGTLQAALEYAEAETYRMQQEVATLRSHLSFTQGEAAVAEADRAALAEQLATLEALRDALQAELETSAAQQLKLQNQVATVDADHFALQELPGVGGDGQPWQERLAEAEAYQTGLQEQLDMLEAHRVVLQDQWTAAEASRGQLQEALEQAEHHRTDLVAQLEMAHTLQLEREAQLDALHSALDRAQADKLVLRHSLAQEQEQAAIAHNEAEQALKNLERLRADLMCAQLESAGLLAAAEVAQQERDRFQQALGLLQEALLGYGSTGAEVEVTALYEAAARQREHVQMLEGAIAQQQADHLQTEATLVDLRYQLEAAQSITAQLESEVATLRAHWEQGLDQHSSLENECTVLRRQLLMLQEERRVLETDFETAQEQIQNFVLEQANAAMEQAGLQVLTAALQTEKADLESALASLQEHMAAVEVALITAGNEREALQEQVLHLQREQTDLQNEKATLKQELAIAQNRIANLDAAASGTTEEQAEILAQLNALQVQNAEVETQKINLERNYGALKEENQQFEESLGQSAIERQKLLNQTRQLQEKQSQLEQEKAALETEHISLRDRFQGLEVKLSQTTLERNQLQGSLNTLKIEKNGLEQENTILKSQFEAMHRLQEELSNVQAQQQAEAQERSALETQGAELQNRLQHLETNQTNLLILYKAIVGEFPADDVDVVAEIGFWLEREGDRADRLEHFIQALQEDKSALEGAIATLQHQLDTITLAKANLEAEMASFQQQVQGLQDQNTRLETERRALEAQVQAVEAERVQMAEAIAQLQHTVQPSTVLPPAPKAAAKKKTSGKKAIAIVPTRDSFQKIRGIGPVYEQRLYDAGITTFAALAAQSPERIREVIQSKSRKVGPESWIRDAQAQISEGHAEQQSDD